MPWAGDYWATFRGGISYRWQDEGFEANDGSDYRDFLYSIPSETEVFAMSSEDLDTLSPAEKYALWFGRENLQSPSSITGHQRSFTLERARYNLETYGRDEVPRWTGICNGWSVAALSVPQPDKPVTVQTPSDQNVTFYAEDIKALVSQIYFDAQPLQNIVRLGSACFEERPQLDRRGRTVNQACRDVNPMSFHLALAEFITNDRGFVVDIDDGPEIWNQPVYGYDVSFGEPREIDGRYRHAARGTTKIVDVTATLYYIDEALSRFRGFTEEELNRYVKSRRFRYHLELNDSLEILGGEWSRGSKRPDFLWFAQGSPGDVVFPRNYPLNYEYILWLVEQSATGPDDAQ